MVRPAEMPNADPRDDRPPMWPASAQPSRHAPPTLRRRLAVDAATLGLLPVLAAQWMRLLRSMPDVPEADGPREGLVGNAMDGASIIDTNPTTRELLVLGESTAAGVGAARQEFGLAGQLAHELQARLGGAVRWQVVGRSGLCADEVLRDLLPQVAQRGPGDGLDVVVVVLGVNDTKALRSPTRWRRDMAALLHALQRRARPKLIVCTGVPPMRDFPGLPRPLRDVLGARSRLLDAELHQVACAIDEATHDVLHVPFDLPIAASLFCRDGFHPGELGYKRWAELLADAVVARHG